MEFFICDADYIINKRKQFEELYDDYFYVHYPIKAEKKVMGEGFSKEEIDKLAGYVRDGSGIVFVAEQNGEVCGYAHFYIHQFLDEKRITFQALIVKEKYRRINVGKSLYELGEKYAIKNNCDSVDLLVTINNPQAIAFHHKNGFEDVRIHMVKYLGNKKTEI